VNNQHLAIGLATLALSVANIPTARAALITGVTATTDMGTQGGTSLTGIINGTGLPGNVPSLSGQHAIPSNFNYWASQNNTITGNVTFNLNGTYNLTSFSLWNYGASGFGTPGVKGVTIQTSIDGTNFTTLLGAPTQFAEVAGSTRNPEIINFAPVDAAYVKFQILSNYGYPTNTALSEVQFNGTAVATSVPEPLTILGTLTAFGGGAALKRRLKTIQVLANSR
jgi:F5/8 type C domain